MKKIFLTSLVLVIINSFSLQETRANSCKIENQTAPVLSEYLKNNRTVVKNITQAIQEEEKGSKRGNYGKQLLSRTYNEIISRGNYGSYFEYYILFPVFNDLPYQVKRDHSILQAESDGLGKYLNSIIKRGYDNISITNEQACRGVTQKCELAGSAVDIVSELIQNHSKILRMYQDTAVGDNKKFGKENELILIDTFTLQQKVNEENYMEQHYAPGNNCVKAKGSFGEKTKALLERMKKNASGSKNGIKRLKDAWKLASGIDTPEEKELERNILGQELARQGVGGTAADATLETLDEFNSGTGINYTPSNNPIANTYKYLESTISQQASDFAKNVFIDPYNKNKQAIDEEEANIGRSIQSLQQEQQENDIDVEIAQRVNRLYQSHKVSIIETEINNSSIENKIIDLHLNLNQSIQTLTCEVAVRVCESQGKGKGICGKCD